MQANPILVFAKTADVIARMEAIAGGTNDVLVKLSLRQIAAKLRAADKAKRIRRSKTLGPMRPGRTTGENGDPRGDPLPGWGPGQYIDIGDTAFQGRKFEIWLKCVKPGKMKLADLDCFSRT